jgi:hypothetical protein
LNYDNVNYGSATVVSILLQLYFDRSFPLVTNLINSFSGEQNFQI